MLRREPFPSWVLPTGRYTKNPPRLVGEPSRFPDDTARDAGTVIDVLDSDLQNL
jgi:hypothetical protein